MIRDRPWVWGAGDYEGCRGGSRCVYVGGGGGGQVLGGRLRPCFWRASELHKEGNSVTWAAF